MGLCSTHRAGDGVWVQLLLRWSRKSSRCSRKSPRHPLLGPGHGAPKLPCSGEQRGSRLVGRSRSIAGWFRIRSYLLGGGTRVEQPLQDQAGNHQGLEERAQGRDSPGPPWEGPPWRSLP